MKVMFQSDGNALKHDWDRLERAQTFIQLTEQYTVMCTLFYANYTLIKSNSKGLSCGRTKKKVTALGAT